MKFTTHFDLHSQASRLSSNNSPRAYTESNMLLYHTATMPRAVKGRAPTRSGLPGVLLVCTRVTHIHIFTCISTRIDVIMHEALTTHTALLSCMLCVCWYCTDWMKMTSWSRCPAAQKPASASTCMLCVCYLLTCSKTSKRQHMYAVCVLPAHLLKNQKLKNNDLHLKK